MQELLINTELDTNKPQQITITRDFDPAVVDRIKDNFIESPGYQKVTIASELKERMINSPDDTFVITSDDFFLTGWKIRDYGWLDQSYCLDRKTAEFGMKLFEDWCRSKGFSLIVAETSRSSSAMHRRWGFTERSVMMEKTI